MHEPPPVVHASDMLLARELDGEIVCHHCTYPLRGLGDAHVVCPECGEGNNVGPLLVRRSFPGPPRRYVPWRSLRLPFATAASTGIALGLGLAPLILAEGGRYLWRNHPAGLRSLCETLFAVSPYVLLPVTVFVWAIGGRWWLRTQTLWTTPRAAIIAGALLFFAHLIAGTVVSMLAILRWRHVEDAAFIAAGGGVLALVVAAAVLDLAAIERTTPNTSDASVEGLRAG